MRNGLEQYIMKRIGLLFIILILFVVLTNLFAYTSSATGLESFTPRIRGFYRPHLRSINKLTEHYTNKYGLQVSNLLRKYNIF